MFGYHPPSVNEFFHAESMTEILNYVSRTFLLMTLSSIKQSVKLYSPTLLTLLLLMRMISSQDDYGGNQHKVQEEMFQES